MPLFATNTPIDTWIGGLPAGGVTVVKGATGCGKTALLHSLAHRIAEGGMVPHYIGCDQLLPGHSQVNGFDQMSRIVRSTNANIFLVDDLTSYYVDGRGMLAARARHIQHLCRFIIDQGLTVVFSAQTQRGVPMYGAPVAGGGKSLTFSAECIIDLDIAATLERGVLLHMEISKHRHLDTSKVKPATMAVMMNSLGEWRGEAA